MAWLHTCAYRTILATTALAGFCLAPAASAIVFYSDMSGSAFDFTSMSEETTSAGDAEPLWGAPTVVGNTLVFTPTGYTSSAGNGTSDTTSSSFNLSISSQDPFTMGVNRLMVNEIGDYSLTGVGTSATSASVLASASLVISEVNVGGVIQASALGGAASDLVEFDTPTQGADWTASLDVDVQAIVDAAFGVGVAYATRIDVIWDNALDTTSESGTNSFIQKKVGLPAVTMQVIPEPGAAVLLGIGLLALARRDRERI